MNLYKGCVGVHFTIVILTTFSKIEIMSKKVKKNVKDYPFQIFSMHTSHRDVWKYKEDSGIYLMLWFYFFLFHLSICIELH